MHRNLNILLLVGMFLSSVHVVTAAEKPLAGKDFILAGNHKIMMNNRASIQFSPTGMLLTPYMKTDKWRGFYSNGTRIRKLVSGKDHVWKYSVTVPAKTAPVAFESTLACPQGADAAHYSLSWKLKTPSDCREIFLYLHIPVKQLTGKKFLINGKMIPVMTEKHDLSWFRQTGPLSLTIFPGEKGKSLTFTSKQPLRINCETHKSAKRVWVRFYTVGKTDSAIDLKISAQ